MTDVSKHSSAAYTRTKEYYDNWDRIFARKRGVDEDGEIDLSLLEGENPKSEEEEKWSDEPVD